MVKSMTGYGNYESIVDESGVQIKVEMKSVNHRFCEISVRMPRSMLSLEDTIKKLIQQSCSRGRFDVFITLEEEKLANKSLKVDEALLQAFQATAEQLEQKYGIQGQLTISDLLRVEGLFQIEEDQQDIEQYKQEILATVSHSLHRLVEMRIMEGGALALDLQQRILHIRNEITSLQEYAPSVEKQYAHRVENKIKDFLEQRADFDEARLMQEVAIFAEKSNIDEEITRLRSHTDQFQLVLKEETPIGRKLDFLLQEMNREVNTIGSKANDIHISQYVVELKSELEKLREQVQNIE